LLILTDLSSPLSALELVTESGTKKFCSCVMHSGAANRVAGFKQHACPLSVRHFLPERGLDGGVSAEVLGAVIITVILQNNHNKH